MAIGFVLDWSWACIKLFNKDIGSVNAYLIKFYVFLNKKGKKCNFVIIQLCFCHYINIIRKDIEHHATSDDQKKIIRKISYKGKKYV